MRNVWSGGLRRRRSEAEEGWLRKAMGGRWGPAGRYDGAFWIERCCVENLRGRAVWFGGGGEHVGLALFSSGLCMLYRGGAEGLYSSALSALATRPVGMTVMFPANPG